MALFKVSKVKSLSDHGMHHEDDDEAHVVDQEVLFCTHLIALINLRYIFLLYLLLIDIFTKQFVIQHQHLFKQSNTQIVSFMIFCLKIVPYADHFGILLLYKLV